LKEDLDGSFELNLTVGSSLMLLLYFVLVLAVGVAFKARMKTGRDFFQAGRGLSVGVGSMALLGASLGIPEVIVMGAIGAQYGRSALLFFGIGAIPALLCAGVFMMPLYYGSKVRSVPEYLRLRFDEKTRALQACLFSLMVIFSSGISIHVMARLIQALHLFDALFPLAGSAPTWTSTTIVFLSVAIVMVYVLLGGLSSSAHNQAWQFMLLIAVLVPAVVAGLHSAGGWSAVMASASMRSLDGANSALQSGHHSLSIRAISIAMGMSFVLGTGYWCCDFREIQIPMAAKDSDSARYIPLFGAMLKLFLPLLVVLPGMIAIGLPTPHTTTIVREEGGVIYHTVTIIPANVSEGKGLIPAKAVPGNGSVIFSRSGRPELDYEMATPNLLLHFVPTPLLGLALSALLASFMSGFAANVTALNTVFTVDLYQGYIRKGASEQHYLQVGRWVTVGGILLSTIVALAAADMNHLIGLLGLLFSLLNAPLLATLLLGMFWKRATGHGAFAGLLSGVVVAMLHYGLTLPIEAQRGIQGGWIALARQYPNELVQNFYGAIFSFSTSLFVTFLVSLGTKRCPESQLAGLVHSHTRRQPNAPLSLWKKPEALAVGILLLALVIGFVYG
jgi:SSS family solute:Na+ symporter